MSQNILKDILELKDPLQTLSKTWMPSCCTSKVPYSKIYRIKIIRNLRSKFKSMRVKSENILELNNKLNSIVSNSNSNQNNFNKILLIRTSYTNQGRKLPCYKSRKSTYLKRILILKRRYSNFKFFLIIQLIFYNNIYIYEYLNNIIIQYYINIYIQFFNVQETNDTQHQTISSKQPLKLVDFIRKQKLPFDKESYLSNTIDTCSILKKEQIKLNSKTISQQITEQNYDHCRQFINNFNIICNKQRITSNAYRQKKSISEHKQIKPKLDLSSIN